ncbi:MAG: tRNA pseudouridine(38-40) synthase TruA [Cellvibrionales bacterium]|nr:tRNA pseudouridine(38-40) synthase TruA [Cellvibrionales bacterium]
MPGTPPPPGMHRVALGIEYDGSAYCGWQRQAHVASVQQALEEALAWVADAPVSLICAGRTDAGVHACEQVAHFDTRAHRRPESWVRGANSALDRAIALRWAQEMPGDFHARFTARARTYRYVIANTRHRPALAHRGLTWVPAPLDAAAMHRALKKLRGEHDYSSFRAAGCQSRSATRHLSHTAVTRHGERILIELRANAFVLHMVRNIVGSLLDVGRGTADESHLLRLLELRDRTRAGPTAPPTGLYLFKVSYPPHFTLPNLPPNPACPATLGD